MPSIPVVALTISTPPLAKLDPTDPSPTMPPLTQASETNTTSWSPAAWLKPANLPLASWMTLVKSLPRPQSVVLSEEL